MAQSKEIRQAKDRVRALDRYYGDLPPKTACVICGKETRASRYGITERPIDVCYMCHENSKRRKRNES